MELKGKGHTHMQMNPLTARLLPGFCRRWQGELLILLNERLFHCMVPLLPSALCLSPFINSFLSLPDCVKAPICTPGWEETPLPFDPKEWHASNFSSQYYPWITHLGHKNKGKKLNLRRSLTNPPCQHLVWWTVWRIYIMMLCKAKSVQSVVHAPQEMYREQYGDLENWC